MKPKTYLFLNFILAGFILAIFLYAAINKADKTYHPVKCIHGELLGAKCPTCGMWSGFSAIVKGKFNEAYIFQPNSMMISLFLFIQLLMRITVIFLLKKTSIYTKTIFNIDIILTMILFFLMFKHIILQTFYIFYKMLSTGNVA